MSFFEREPDAPKAALEANMKQAEAAFRQAYKLDATKSEAVRWNLASALEWLRRDEEAAELFSDPPYVVSAEPPRPVDSSGEQKPVVIKRIDPEYPPRARAQAVAGSVVVASIIGTEGTVEHIQVLQGQRGCTIPAIRALRQWRFQPATLDGQPIAVYFTLTVTFKPSQW